MSGRVGTTFLPRPRGRELLRLCAAQFGLRDLVHGPTVRPGRRLQTYGSNEHIWRDVLEERVRSGAAVRLDNFTVSDWFPHQPGRFHTGEGPRAAGWRMGMY